MPVNATNKALNLRFSVRPLLCLAAARWRSGYDDNTNTGWTKFSTRHSTFIPPHEVWTKEHNDSNFTYRFT
jgi:hypothetical protein